MRLFIHIRSLVLLCVAFQSSGLFAQQRLEPHYVQLNVPQEWQFQRTGQRSWVITDTKTEFNVILYKVHPAFNADSLRYLALDLYQDPNLQNVQAMEVNSGTLNGIPADRVVISFIYGDARYLSTLYLAHFHINHQYNSVLFYFEIGEGNAVSYVGIQDQLLSSLSYLPFEFGPRKGPGFSLDIAYHWLVKKTEEDGDSVLAWFTDGRSDIKLYRSNITDSLSSATMADLAKDVAKKASNHKVAKEREKSGWKGLDIEGISITTDKKETQKWYYLMQQDSSLHAYVLEGAWPLAQRAFYASAWQKAWQSLSLEGKYLP